MHQHPKITIITPSLNQGQFIEETITSVINQDYPNLQYIIIDGGSTDNTVDIIKKYESKIDYWVSEKDNGQCSAINKGLKIANGDIINWLNSDDMLADNSLNSISEFYNANKHCNIFIGQTIYFNNNKSTKTISKTVFNTRECTFGYGHINQPATFYKKEAINNIGMLDESLHYCMDLDWWLKYLLRYDIHTIALTNSYWAKFRFHENSKSITSSTKFKKEKNLIYSEIFDFYSTQKNKQLNSIKYPDQTSLNLGKAQNYYDLWQSDELCLEDKKMESFRQWLKVNPFKLINSEKRRYAAVLKNILFN